MRYPVIVTPDPQDGGFVAECPAIPGCISEGETVEDAIANIRDAIRGCLTVLREKGQAPPASVDPLLATVEVSS